MTTEMQFPRCMRAGKKVDVDQWELGDALLKEADDKATGPRGLRAVVRAFAEQTGLEYDERYLRLLRQTADTFPPARRYDGENNKPMVVLRAHTAAGNPDSLDVIVKACRKDGIGVTLENVELIQRKMRKEERENRQQEQEAAKIALNEAEAEEARAIKRKNNAKTGSDEHRRASEDREQARTTRERAKERVRSLKGAPKRKDLPAPKEESVGGLLTTARFSADISGILSTVRRMAREIEPSVEAGELSGTFIEASVEELNEVRVEIGNLVNLLRRNKGKSKGGLYAVQ